MTHRTNLLLIGLILGLAGAGALQAAPAIGLFESNKDVGQVANPGSAIFDIGRRTYLVAGGGENMWFTNDAFHFVWKRVSGDLQFSARVRWAEAGGNAHRKACLLIRQSLEPNAAYADAVIHGDGLCSLQYRESPGAPTREIQSNVKGPSRIRIERQGDFVAMSIGVEGDSFRAAGGSFKIRFEDPVYVGLGVCAHDNRALETAIFSDVELASNLPKPGTNTVLESTLETVAIASKDRRVVYHTAGLIEAPNWSGDGKFFIFNRGGRLYRIAREGGQPQLLESGIANRCNNDHGISPDGKQLAISHHGPGGKSLIYLLPIDGGVPVQVTSSGPSYWHGWTPDGKTLAYCAERNGNFDIYTIPVSGGEETRLTTAPGLDDGPDYSPDGQYIYFNSERGGSMKIWRMKADGSQQEQVTSESGNHWFPHPSPDGKWIAYLAYGDDVQGHPANQDVELRLRPVAGGETQPLAKLFGGQGTINVPSWSPDSKQLAFVSYRLVRAVN